jgi:protein-arginine kinase activator protein McsA
MSTKEKKRYGPILPRDGCDSCKMKPSGRHESHCLRSLYSNIAALLHSFDLPAEFSKELITLIYSQTYEKKVCSSCKKEFDRIALDQILCSDCLGKFQPNVIA